MSELGYETLLNSAQSGGLDLLAPLRRSGPLGHCWGGANSSIADSHVGEDLEREDWIEY